MICLVAAVLLVFAEYFDYSVVLHRTVDALAYKAVVVGAVGGVGGIGIPELFLFVDVVNLVDEVSPAVVDGEFVVGVALVFDEVGDAEDVVVAVAVGGDEVGEGDGAGNYLDGVEEGVGTFNEVAGDADVLFGLDEPYLIVGGEGYIGNVPGVGWLDGGGGVEVVGCGGAFFKQPEEGAGGVEGDGVVGEFNPGTEFGGESGVEEEAGSGRGDDVDAGGVGEGVGAAEGVGDGEGEGVESGGVGVGEEGGVVGRGALGEGGAVAEVPCGGVGVGSEVAEVEGVG